MVMVYSPFFLTFGSLLVLIAVMSSWLFRTSSAPLYAKLAAPVLVIALAIAAPFRVAAMLGFPTSVTPPAQAELIAYVPDDEDGRVYLWLKSGGQPRAYDVLLDDKLKKTLREAQGKLKGGERVMLRKARPTHAGVQNTPSPAPAYEIDASAFGLPSKDN